jgi:hypothetical protein
MATDTHPSNNASLDNAVAYDFWSTEPTYRSPENPDLLVQIEVASIGSLPTNHPCSSHTSRGTRGLPRKTAGPIDQIPIDQPPPFRIPAKNPTATAARFLSRLRSQTLPEILAMGYGAS